MLANLPVNVQEHQQVTMGLDTALDPATFRAQHDQMVNGGWSFPLQVGTTKYEVKLTARPGEWSRLDSAPTADNGAGFERAATAKVAAPGKQTLTVSTKASRLKDHEITLIDPTSSGDPLGLITVSGRAGGYAHLTSTSLKAASEATTKTAFTGPAHRYVSTFEYDAVILGPNGLPLPKRPGHDQPVTADVTAEIARVDGTRRAPADDRTKIRPLEITGLDEVLGEVFSELPRERLLDGTAHNAIRDFLSPRNVLARYEQAADGGLISPTLTLSDGRHAWLRLTVAQDSTHPQGVVAQKQSHSTRTSSENGTGRLKFHSWKAGASGGVSFKTWQAAAPDLESSWLTFTLGYSYTPTRLYEQWVNQGFSAESSVERTGTGDLFSTDVTFRVEVLRQNSTPDAGSRHGISRAVISDKRRTEPGALHRPVPRDEETPPPRGEDNPPPLRGRVLGLRDRAPETAVPLRHHADRRSLDSRATGMSEADTQPERRDAPAHPDAPQDLRAPLVSHRATVIDFPGARELETSIAQELRRVAPGVLPSADARNTPQALRNEQTFRDHLSEQHLLSNINQLLDGTYGFGLDTPTGRRTATVRIWTELMQGTHEDVVRSTAEHTVTMNVTNEHKLLNEPKHEVNVGPGFRRALNEPDTTRANPSGGAGIAGALVGVDIANTETHVSRGFVHNGTADVFGYEVTHHYSITLHEKGSAPDPAAWDSTPDPGVTVRPAGDARLRVDLRRPEVLPAPPSPRFDHLPTMHAITHVTDADGFRGQVRGALDHAYADFGRGRVDQALRLEGPDLGEAVRALTGETQLRGLLSASHSGWINTLDQHIGTGRNRKTVGVAVRTGPFRDWTFRQTYTDITQQLKVRSTTATTAGDQKSYWLNGSLGVEFSDNPSTPAGELTTSHQERGGVKGKVGHHGEWNDMLTQETTTARTVSQTGIGHLYEATVDADVVGRITDADGTPHIGPSVPHTYKVLVMLSDEDVTRSLVTQRPHDIPEKLQATLLDKGITGGTVVRILDTDPILRDIHRQLGGDPNSPVPVKALPFANAFSAETVSARFDDIAGSGIVERFVHTTHDGHVITEVHVRGTIDKPWGSEGHHSNLRMTSETQDTHKVKGEKKRVWGGGVEAGLRGAIDPPLEHLNAVWGGGTFGLEGSREVGVQSGASTTAGSKITGFGDTSYLFTNKVRWHVVVTQRFDNGPFLALQPPLRGGVGPADTAAWVPESLVEVGNVKPYPQIPEPVESGPSRRRPDIEQGRSPAEPKAEWQTSLRRAHHLVGFDNGHALLTSAVNVQADSHRWGPGLLGQLGGYSSAALTTVARTAWWATAPLSGGVVQRAEQFLRNFTADPRLADDFDVLNREKGLSLREQLALRQAFSAQSLSALFHRLQDAEVPYRITGTSVAVSMHAIGPAETLSHRTAAQDELTVAVAGVSGTHTLRSRRWDLTPTLSVLTNKPLVSLPLNTAHFNSEELSFDHSNPVTLTPGVPSRDTPVASLPRDLAPSEPGRDMDPPEPGKVKIAGAVLQRQPVEFTLRHWDGHGRYGTPVPVPGHVLLWSAATAPTAPGAEHPSAARPSSSTPGSLRRAATDDSAAPAPPPRTGHDTETRGEDRLDRDAVISEAFRPTATEDPQPLPPGAKRTGKQPAYRRGGLGMRVALARDLAPELLAPFSNTDLTAALSHLERSEQSSRTTLGDTPVMDRARAERLATEAQAEHIRSQAASDRTTTDLPPRPALTSRTDDPRRTDGDQPSPIADRTERDTDATHEPDASTQPSPLTHALGEIGRNGGLYSHPTQHAAIRLRGPRWSHQDTRTPNRLSAAQWQELPPATRAAARSERLQTTLDPQTLAETDQSLFRSIARVGRLVTNTPLGNAEVLEQLGRRDPETHGYWDLQDARDHALGQAARSALTEYNNSQPELREATRAAQVRAVFDSGDNHVQTVEQLLSSYNGVAMGGNHAATPIWTFLVENMEVLHLDTIYLESIRGDSYQADVDAYLGGDAAMPDRLDAYIRLHDRNIENNGLRALLEAARRHHVRVVGVDGRPARRPRTRTTANDRNSPDYHRAATLNTYMAGLIRADQADRPDRRYVVALGNAHVGTRPGPSHQVDIFGSMFNPDDTFPGVDNLLGIPALLQDNTAHLRPYATTTRESTPGITRGNLHAGQAPVSLLTRSDSDDEPMFVTISDNDSGLAGGSQSDLPEMQYMNDLTSAPRAP
ncbi:hypothetical protein [Streptomyces sp. NPDC091209]|uniref:hypothetical protein n=1 Tax=Streptomyces sp. NPDC091209 TaxID=3365974 RepID=UPI0037F3C5EE